VTVASKLELSAGEVRATIQKEIKDKTLGSSEAGREYVKELIKNTR
jgi:hypothetical protein